MLKYLFARKVLSIFAISGLLLMPLAVAAGGFESQLLLGNQTLYLNGEGPRKKAFLTVYDAALYLTEKGSDAAAIIEADHPMAIAMVVRSRFATASRISEAFREGLEKSSGGDTQAFEAQIDRFLAVFEDGVVKGDSYKFIYIPESGLNIYKNDEVRTQIEGLDFKQALYGVWLSENPVSTTLKSPLLGK